MDLEALQSYLQGLGSPLTLAAGDPRLPAELTEFLKAAPGHQLVLTPDASGISLSGQTLTVNGTSTEKWVADGFATTLALSAAQLTILDGSPPKITLLAKATLQIGAVAVEVSVASPASKPGAWQIALEDDVPDVTPQALIELAFAWDLPFPMPPELDLLTQQLVLRKAGFTAAFVPGSPEDALLEIAISAPQAKLTLVAGVAELEGLTLQALIKPSSISMTVIGELEIGGVMLDIGVGFSPGGIWTAFISPPEGKSFPGIAALADWLAGKGSSQAGEIAAGFTNVSFDPKQFDAAIERVALSFELTGMKLVSFEVDSQLTIAALPLDVTLSLPELTVSGTLHDQAAVKVSEVLGALGLPTSDLPVDTEISLVRFAAEPGRSCYVAELHLEGLAKAGPFDLEAISVLISYAGAEGFSGSFCAQMSVWELGAIDAVAQYSAAEGWTWSARTAPGQDLQLGAIIANLGQEFGLKPEQIPQPIRTLDLHALTLTYASGSSTFDFAFTGDFTVADVEVEIVPSIHVAPVAVGEPASGWNYDFGGTIAVGFVELALAFDRTSTGSSTFVASLSTGAQGMPASVDLASFVGALSPKLGAEIPAGITVDLKSAKLASIERVGGARSLALGLDLGASIPLSDLPLIGDRLPADESVSIEDLQVSYSSAAVTAAEAKALNAQLPQAVQFPGVGLAEGVGFAATVSIAGSSQTLSLGLAPPPQPVGSPSLQPGPPSLQPGPLSLQSGPPSLQTRPSASGGAPSTTGRSPSAPRNLPATSGEAAAAPTAKWFDVQRQLGAVQFSRVGVLYAEGVLFFAIDASIALGPLTISLDGLGVGSQLTKFSPQFTLTGAGIAYEQPPLRIGGAVLRIVPPPKGTTFELDGSLVIEAEQFGIAAVGSYAVLDSGAPSLFVFGQLSAALGGPPAFFVTGLMAGFGVNRTLTIPSPTEVAGFPLLALNEPPTPGQQAPPQTPGHVLDVIEGRQPLSPGGVTKTWIEPSPGAYWFAAGLTATHFELVNSRAVVVVETGKDLVIALLGLASISLPQAADSSFTYAYAELELEAVLEPEAGYFGLTAILAPSSYVLVPECKLTGGFAFAVWFGENPHAGQFVLTLGGYHPAFTVPDYFPSVPRLGFSWAVSSSVSISGGAYLALTPSAAMAGGSLAALFQEGDLRAWFTANADMLISWRPFHFTASIDVEIGVSYRLNLLVCHKTIEVSLGASVDLWGPPTGGRVHVHLWCVSFTVSFGSDGAGASDDPLDWGGFSSLLPDAAAVVSLQPTGGLTQALESKSSTSGKTWIVRATAFSFTTESAVPASHLCTGEAKPGDPTCGAIATAAPLDIRPMNLTGMTAVHRLIVREGSEDASPHELQGWSLQPRPRNVPEALWGAPPSPFTQTPAQPKAQLVAAQPVGLAVAPPPPVFGATRGVFALQELAEEKIGTTSMPLDPDASTSSEYVPFAAPGSIGDIAGIATAASHRSGLIAVLGDLYEGGDDMMSALGAEAATLFAAAPMEETST